MKKPIMTIHPLNVMGYAEPHQTRPYKYPVFAFAFLTEGECLVEIENQKHLLSAGQFILVPENKTISLLHFNGCVGFDGCFALDYLKDASYSVLRSTSPIVQSFWFEDAVFVAALMKRMLAAFEDKDHLFLQSALDMILGQIRPRGPIAVVPEKFLQLVFDKDKAPMSVSEYADILKVTPNYLNKTVKSHTHRTAIDWIEIARLNLAKQLLKDPSIPIVDVAVRAGLVDQSYFSRFFKKKTGLTPSQFRNKR